MDWFLYDIGLRHERVNMDEVLSVDSSSTVFVFGDFNILHKDWVTYSSGTDRPGKLCYNFSISNDLNQMVNFPTGIPGSDSHNPALLDLFLTLVFVLQGLSFQKFMTVSTDFSSNLKKDVSFWHLRLFSSWLGWSSWSCWERFHGKSSASKVKCRQASNRCKRILKTKEYHSLETSLALVTFGELVIVFSRKINLLYLLYLTDLKCCLLLLIKANCLLFTVLLKLHNIHNSQVG